MGPHTACHEVLALISHNFKERVVSLNDFTAPTLNADTDDISLDQTSDFGLALLEAPRAFSSASAP